MTRRMTWTTGALLGAVVAVPTALTAQRNCEFRDDIELAGRAFESLKVDAGAGKLVITGRAGIDDIRIAATLCASDRDRLEALAVTLDGDRLETDYPRGGSSGWFGGNRYARIDLVVEVPAGTNLRLEDGSGSLEIRSVGGDVLITDGSGSIEVRGVGGSVRVNGAGSGSVSVHDVDGDLVVTDTRRSRIRYSDIRGVLDLPPSKRGG